MGVFRGKIGEGCHFYHQAGFCRQGFRYDGGNCENFHYCCLNKTQMGLPYSGDQQLFLNYQTLPFSRSHHSRIEPALSPMFRAPLLSQPTVAKIGKCKGCQWRLKEGGAVPHTRRNPVVGSGRHVRAPVPGDRRPGKTFIYPTEKKSSWKGLGDGDYFSRFHLHTLANYGHEFDLPYGRRQVPLLAIYRHKLYLQLDLVV